MVCSHYISDVACVAVRVKVNDCLKVSKGSSIFAISTNIFVVCWFQHLQLFNCQTGYIPVTVNAANHNR